MAQSNQFYEIYDFYYRPFWQHTWFWQYVAFGFALFIFSLWLMRRRTAKQGPQTPLLPWDWAISEFTNLSPEEYESKEAFKTFYFHLTLVLKSYFHKRYGWPLEDKTDEEFLSYLRYKKFDKRIVEELAGVLNGAASVKFANMDALPLQAKNDLEITRNIVVKTAPSHELTSY